MMIGMKILKLGRKLTGVQRKSKEKRRKRRNNSIGMYFCWLMDIKLLVATCRN